MGDRTVPAFLNVKSVKARQRHTCCECGIDIQPGQKYQLSTGCWDGQVEAFKQCVDCHALMGDIIDFADSDQDVCFAELNDWVYEFRDDVAGDVKMQFERFIERYEAARCGASREIT